MELCQRKSEHVAVHIYFHHQTGELMLNCEGPWGICIVPAWGSEDCEMTCPCLKPFQALNME